MTMNASDHQCDLGVERSMSNILKSCFMKVSKGAKIRNRYNQVPHLTRNTNSSYIILMESVHIWPIDCLWCVDYKKKLFVAFPWVETSTGPGGFMICVFII